MNCSQPRIPARVMAPFIAFSVGMAGLALIANQPEPTYAPETVASRTVAVTAPDVKLTYDSPTVTTEPSQDFITAPAVQAWTPEPATEDAAPVTEDARCEEDMPCWDCETMGNRICGTIDDSAEAWAVWDEVGASRGVTGGEDQFRVDYMASSDTFPENLTAQDVPLMGRDGRWYVFHVTIGGDEGTGNIAEPADNS